MSAAPGSIQRCGECRQEHPEHLAATACPACGGLLLLHHPDPGPAAALRGAWDASPRWGSGVWRYREVVLPSAADADLVSHPEGNTPLLHRDALDAWAGVEGLRLKHEGHNPTGSFKDRGMTVAVTQARRLGVRAVACASTGNTSASLAAYAALAGLPALVLVPAGKVAAGKLGQALAHGATVVAVEGDFDACLRLVGEAARDLGIYLVNSVNPFRVEGQKTIILELLQQLGWEAPDWIAVPAGNLGNTAAFGKALEEAHRWGLIDRLPRLLAVQAAGAAPFARGFAEGFRRRVAVEADTVATAIRIGAPASWDRAVAAIRATDGVVVAVTDAEILAAKAAVDQAGVGCEPASAAAVAGVRHLAAAGTLPARAQVVAILTGHLLKDPVPEPPEGIPGPPRPLRIVPTLAALARVVEGVEGRARG